MVSDLEKKSFYDRANFFIGAQAVFVNAFATLVVSSNLVGAYKFLPIIICSIGISLNLVWIYSSYISADVRKLIEMDLKDIIYRVAPFLLTIGWIALLIVFSLQAFGIINITI
jgi:hypothetical protein